MWPSPRQILSRTTVSSQWHFCGRYTGHVTCFGGKLLWTDVTMTQMSMKPLDFLFIYGRPYVPSNLETQTFGVNIPIVQRVNVQKANI